MRSAYKRHLGILRDPITRSALSISENALVSAEGSRFPILPDGKVSFVPNAKLEEAKGKREFLDQVKAAGKGLFGRYYVWLIYVVSPVLPRIHWRTGTTYWKYLALKQVRPGDEVIQIGSGNDRVSEEIVNLDLFGFPEVDIVADCSRLPYADGSLDGVISSAVFEHVPDPSAIMTEIFRVLKPGGFVVTGVPFLQGYHGSPSDFTRWTHQGLRTLHEKYGLRDNEVYVTAGPTSSLLWISQEWLAMVLSLGFLPLYYFWFFSLLALTFPLKLFDTVLVYHPLAWRISSFHVCVGFKPE